MTPEQAEADDPARELARKTAEISALREISRAIGATFDLDTTLTLITRTTAEVMRVDSCSIYLLDASREYLVLKATTGLAAGRGRRGAPQVRRRPDRVGGAARPEPVASTNAAKDPRFKLLPETHESLFQSLLAVPLTVEGRTLGAINVQTTGTHAWGDDEIELLSIIADLASGTLEKARLHDSMRRQILELRTLAEASETLTSPLYLEQILRLLVEMAARVLAGAAVHADAARGRGARARRLAPRGPRAAAPAGAARRRGRPRGGGGDRPAGRERRSRGRSAASARTSCPNRAPVRSLLSVPLRVRDHTLGVVNCYTARRHAFTPSEISMLQTLANQTALAIENASLVVKSAMVREMHHRVKNNLQMIAMLLRLQLRDGREVSGREVLTETINRILSIAGVHEILAAEGLRQVAVHEMLERVAQTVQQTMARPGLALDVKVSGDDLSLPSQQATSLALVVNELLQNAMEHAFAGRGRGTVMITLAAGRDTLRVEVQDDGVGLPEGFAPDRSAGLGLQIVHTLVGSDLKGQIAFGGPGGTRAVITMPRPQGS